MVKLKHDKDDLIAVKTRRRSITSNEKHHRAKNNHVISELDNKRGASIESPLFVSGPYLNISKSNRANLFEKQPSLSP